MKFSEAWLREWVNPKLTRDALCEKLTMSGLEVEEVLPVASNFKGVVVGEVVSTDKHPKADKLTLCKVNVGKKKMLDIVCGAHNVAANIRVPVAIIGAELSGGIRIKETKLRDATSQGMLCSAAELGLAEESDGLLLLPEDAPIGENIRDYLHLDDYTIDLSITPNRGDCLGMKGIARELSAISSTKVKAPALKAIKPLIKDKINVTVKSKQGCPNYVGRVIRGIDASAPTPIWMRERLRRSGLRSINIVVDVTNYVMLELGQPMHAFDLSKIDKMVVVRMAQEGEKLSLLDGTEQSLQPDTMIIADRNKPLAIAGIMGGLESGVTSVTEDIFLESACFSADTIAYGRQVYQLNSDSSYRFERQVDPAISREAIERASKLILDYAGGQPGVVITETATKYMRKACKISLDKDKIEQVLGVAIPDTKVQSIFKSLGFGVKKLRNGWSVTVPTFRADITFQEDLIEELARIFGYNDIPATIPYGDLAMPQTHDSGELLDMLRESLSGLGYHEIISYSFVNKKLQTLLDTAYSPKEVLNPITADMDVMRTNLWPGLINALIYNKSRQQDVVRLFELGVCFHESGKQLHQPAKLAGIVSGPVSMDQWGLPTRKVDFYDVKGDLSNLLQQLGLKKNISFSPCEVSALHPGQAAEITVNDKNIGIIGKLNPSLTQKLGLSEDVYLFELSVEGLQQDREVLVRDVSKFPEIRRDVAIIVREAVPAGAIQGKIIESAGPWLKDIFIFDLYQGKGVTPGFKSIAFGLVIQDESRTLVDDEVAELMQRVVTALKGQFGAELRS